MELRAQVCTSGSSRDPVDLVVFDNDPADGNVIDWKRMHVSNKGKCEGTWFSWTPTHGPHDLVATILPNAAPPKLPDNALLTSGTQKLTKTRLEGYVP